MRSVRLAPLRDKQRQRLVGSKGSLREFVAADPLDESETLEFGLWEDAGGCKPQRDLLVHTSAPCVSE